MSKKSKRQQFMLRAAIIDGQRAFVPADNASDRLIDTRHYKVGDLLAADISKPRHPGYHRYAHRLGQLIVDSIDGFESLEAHAALKRLQMESGVQCEEIAIMLPGFGMVAQRIPLSLSYASMDEGQFRQTIQGLCNFLCERYWPSESLDSITELIEAMPEVA